MNAPGEAVEHGTQGDPAPGVKSIVKHSTVSPGAFVEER